MCVITVNDKFQTGYQYHVKANIGDVYTDSFKPFFTPKEMLELGVFEGKYINDCIKEFPEEWFEYAKISQKPDISCNYFKIKSRLPLSEWKTKGWINENDPRGWFQWYCRFFLGRRIEEYDDWQMKRWRAFVRHAGAIKRFCNEGDLSCRTKQRQALLQWSHNPFI
jgi:hypothetical protein